MFKKLVAKLRAIPALGVVKLVENTVGGVVERVYQYKAVLVNYDGIEQVLAFTNREWEEYTSYATVNGWECKPFAIVKKRSYMSKMRNKEVLYDRYVVTVDMLGMYVTLAMLPSELKRAVDHGLKVSSQHKFRTNWFMKLIRKVGLAIFD